MIKSKRLTDKERKYLTNLLNRQVINPEIPYDHELYSIQRKLKLYPRKEKWECPVCEKIFTCTITKIRNTEKVNPDLFCSKKCRKINDYVLSLPKPTNCDDCKRKFDKKVKMWYMLFDYKNKKKTAICYKCG